MKRLVAVLVLAAACSHSSPTPKAAPTAAPTTAAPTPTVVLTTPPPTVPPKPVDEGPVGGPVPKAFTPVSVTFVSEQTGWALGDATCMKPPCTSVVRTRDGGRTWKGVPAPVAAINGEGGPSVSQVRFADLLNGYAFGESLFATPDGGRHWKQLATTGSIASLEVGRGRFWVLQRGCGQAVDTCTKEGHLLSGKVGSDALTDVMPLPPKVTGQVVLHGAEVFVALYRQEEGSPTLVASTGGGFSPREMPCDNSEIPYLAAASSTHLSLVCESLDAGAGQQGKSFFTSSNGGRAWSQHPKPAQIVGTAVAATTGATFVGNSRIGLEATRDGGTTWTLSLPTETGVSYVGFAGPELGEVITGEGLQLTRDAGRTWQKVAF